MKKNQRIEFDEIHWDVLKEISNIGTGNAINSLSMFLDNSVTITMPYIKLLDYDDVVVKLGGSDRVVTGLLLFLSGDMDGMIVFLLDQEFSLKIIDILIGQSFDDLYDINELAISALKELSNIMASSYVNAISQLSGMSIHVSVPSIAIDMVGSIMSVPTIHFGDISSRVLFMENDFSMGEKNMNSSILLFAKDDSIKKMIQTLGVEVK